MITDRHLVFIGKCVNMCPFKKLATGGFPVFDKVDINIEEEKDLFVNSETWCFATFVRS